jgi:hypothetical protein
MRRLFAVALDAGAMQLLIHSCRHCYLRYVASDFAGIGCTHAAKVRVDIGKT